MSGQAGTAVPAAELRRRLRAGSPSAKPVRERLTDYLAWAFVAAVLAALAAGAARPLARLLFRTAHPVSPAPGHLLVVAAALLLLGGLARLLTAAGPVTASSAFRFWLLSAPVRRRDLLRRRYFGMLAVTVAAALVVAVPLAHVASVAALPVVAAAALAAIAVAAGTVWAQACDLADRAAHLTGQGLRAAGVLGFGSLATGVGRSGLNTALHVSPDAAVVLLAVMLLIAVASVIFGYRALDRIDISVLRRGQGLLTAGRVAAVFMDVFMLTEFLAEQRARQAGRLRPVRMGAGLAGALARSEWARLRRRPSLAVRAAAAAVVWWGCRPVLPGPAVAAVAVVTGYFLVLPAAGTLRQLAASPGLRAQFAPHDRWLSRASAAACLLASAAWVFVVAPGLHGGVALAAVMVLGLTAAVYRTVTRPPLDYSGPWAPTPFGDIPLDLWRQQFRGIAALALVTAVVAALGAH